MLFHVHPTNQKSLTVENLHIKMFFQTDAFAAPAENLPLQRQLHTHSYVELFACLAGSITLHTAAGAEFELGGGDVALVPSAVEHFKVPETAPNTRWIGMGFICREVPGGTVDLYGKVSRLTGQDSILVCRRMLELCRIIGECHGKRGEQEFSTVLSLVAELLKLPRGEEPRLETVQKDTQKAKNIDRLLKLDDIININYDKDFSNQEIADLLFISRRQLSRIVAKNYGESLRSILVKKRLDIAAELLRTTRRSVENIAQSVGFKNKNTFHREFKKRFGTTPVEYRKKLPKGR